MKTLVVFYSRTGTTRLVAEAVAQRLNADLEEVREVHPPSQFFGYLKAMLQTWFQRVPPIAEAEHDIATYDLVAFGCPVWASTMPGPARRYLERERDGITRLAGFCTHHDSGADSTFARMESVGGKKLEARAAFKEESVRSGDAEADIEAFIAQLQG